MLKTAVIQLNNELEELIARGFSVDAVDAEGWAMLTFHDYAVVPGFTKSKTELLLKIPLSSRLHQCPWRAGQPAKSAASATQANSEKAWIASNGGFSKLPHHALKPDEQYWRSA